METAGHAVVYKRDPRSAAVYNLGGGRHSNCSNLEAFAMADTIGVMDAGRLHQWDAPYELYHRPATPFVASFVGEGSLLTSSIRRDGTTAYAACSFGEVPLANDVPGDTAVASLLSAMVRAGAREVNGDVRAGSWSLRRRDSYDVGRAGPAARRAQSLRKSPR